MQPIIFTKSILYITIKKIKKLYVKIKKIQELQNKIIQLKQIEKELDLLNTDKFQEEIQSIRKKIKNPNKLDVIELDFSSLKLKIQKSQDDTPNKKSTYYEILGIKSDATPNQIKNIFRNLTKTYHPDKKECHGIKDDKKYREIKEAYETLIDPIIRKEYDKQINKKK